MRSWLIIFSYFRVLLNTTKLEGFLLCKAILCFSPAYYSLLSCVSSPRECNYSHTHVVSLVLRQEKCLKDWISCKRCAIIEISKRTFLMNKTFYLWGMKHQFILWQAFVVTADHPVFPAVLHVLSFSPYNNASQCKWLTVTRSAKLQLKCSFDSLIMQMIKTEVAGSWAKIFFSLMPAIKQRSAVMSR